MNLDHTAATGTADGDAQTCCDAGVSLNGATASDEDNQAYNL